MKKSLIALAVMAAAGAASAQSSVTLFGIVDAAYNHISADRAGGVRGSLSRLTNSGYNSSRLGFRGTEDLGGGMSASFWLEAGLNNDDGTGAASSATNRAIAPFQGATAATSTNGANAPVRSGTQGLTFNRRSTVSLASGFGELRLGRDYVPAFWNHTLFDPFGTNGVGATNSISQNLATILGIPTAVRASNSVGYFLPANLGGIYGQAMYAFGENAKPVTATTAANAFTTIGNREGDGEHIGFRLGYGSGPFNVAVGYGRTKASGAITLAGAQLDVGPAVVPTAANIFANVGNFRYTNWNLAGSWDFGIARAMAQYNQEKIGGDASFKHKTWMIGALVPVGAGEIRASYTRGKSDDNDMKGNQIALGYVHNLSKRTALYTTYSRINNSGDDPLLNYSFSGYSSAGTSIVPNRLGGDTRGFDIGIRHSF